MVEVVMEQTSMPRTHSDSGISSQSGNSGDPDAGVGGGIRGVSRTDLVAAAVDDEEIEGKCGWLWLRPRFLQDFRTAKWVLFWLCWAAAVQGMVVNGFVNVVITTIEKRFDLRSTDTGLIAGAYDIASVMCSVPVSYLGSRRGASKPRWLGWGVFILGVGSFVFTLPHFASPPYSPAGGDSTSALLFCLKEGRSEGRCKVEASRWAESYRHVLVLGQFLHGMGASPLYTLGITFLDESVPVKMSSLYLGIFYAMAVMGPAVGYLLGGQFLKIYIDSPNIKPETVGIDGDSNLWLGGWWIGFLVSGTMAILISWPIMSFPGQLPGSKALKAERVCEAHVTTDAGVPPRSFGSLKELPRAVKELVLNPTFVFLSFAGATEGILLAGFATFIPKFLENQFSMSASSAALIVGCVVVPAGGGGTFLGGWLIKKMRLRCSGILKFCTAFSVVCVLSCLTFVISCPNTNFAGISIEYENRSVTPLVSNLTSVCNAGCGCDDVPYDPVCGTNKVLYFSPCHAGCTNLTETPDGKEYSGCSCVRALPGLEPMDPMDKLDMAVRRKCPSQCGLIVVFLIIFFAIMLLTFIISLPAVSATLRCVPDTHRSFALGLQWIVIRLLGTIPGPILFGALIDNTCTLWQSTCSSASSCRSYDNFYMSRYMMGISIIGKALSTVAFFLAWWLYRPPPEAPTDGGTSDGVDTVVSKGGHPLRELQGIDNPAAELS